MSRHGITPRADQLAAPTETKTRKQLYMEQYFSASPPKERVNIPNNWQAQPLNHSHHYASSPVARHVQKTGNFSADKHMSRTFNRKMKMRDTFTTIFKTYDHNPYTVIKGK